MSITHLVDAYKRAHHEAREVLDTLSPKEQENFVIRYLTAELIDPFTQVPFTSDVTKAHNDADRAYKAMEMPVFALPDMVVIIEMFIRDEWKQVASYPYAFDSIDKINKLIGAVVLNEFNVRITVKCST